MSRIMALNGTASQFGDLGLSYCRTPKTPGSLAEPSKVLEPVLTWSAPVGVAVSFNTTCVTPFVALPLLTVFRIYLLIY